MKNKILIFFFILFLIFFILILNKKKKVNKIEEFFEISNYNLDKYFNKELDKTYPKYNIKKDCIFVSIASYRDDECSDTIISMINNCENSKNIFIGICSQNDIKENKEECIPKNGLSKDFIDSNIRIRQLEHTEALGPNYARYICSHLWRGEEFFLQIDSHLKFIKNWDKILKDMYYKLPGNKSILTHYPPTEEQLNDTNKIPYTCSAHYENNFHIISEAQIIERDNNNLRTPYFSAGFFFAKATFLYDVPYDPFLPYLFQGEEVLMAARLYTHGYDMYNLTQSVASHNYDRDDKPRFWNDNSHKNWQEVQTESNKRYYKIMNLGTEIHPRFQYNIEKYGLGKIRSIDDYFNFTGINPNEKKIVTRCDKRFDFDKNQWV